MIPSQSASVHHPLRGLNIDKQYYLPNADLHFIVEKTIFRVHSYFFTRESPQFRERMAGGDCARAHDGLSDSTAIPIRNTSAAEFSHFLWVFYDPNYTHSTSVSAWHVILRLSSPTHWDFPRIHTLALNNLGGLDLPLVDRIVLYKACDVPVEYLIPLYAELCLREESLTLEEAVRLGWELSIVVSQVRERLLRGGREGTHDGAIVGMSSAVEDATKDQVESLIKSMLKVSKIKSSVMALRELHHSPPRQGPCDQAHLDQITPQTPQKCPVTPATVNAKGKAQSKEPPKSRPDAINQARRIAKTLAGSVKTKNKSGVDA